MVRKRTIVQSKRALVLCLCRVVVLHRCALLTLPRGQTGRHVIHTGVYDPMNGGSGDLSLNFTLLPQHLAALNYTCHMVGKWCGRF